MAHFSFSIILFLTSIDEFSGISYLVHEIPMFFLSINAALDEEGMKFLLV
jgi:hypothetical protein